MRTTFYELDVKSADRSPFAWATGYSPLSGGMPFLFPVDLERKIAYWKVNREEAGLEIDSGGRLWPDCLGCGHPPPSFFLSKRILNGLIEASIPVFRATKMPIAAIGGRALRKLAPPSYYAVEAQPGLTVDYAATGIPVTKEGHPLWDQIRNRGNINWRYNRDSWTGAELFSASNPWNLPSTHLICTERVKEIAEQAGWSNIHFEPINVR